MHHCMWHLGRASCQFSLEYVTGTVNSVLLNVRLCVCLFVFFYFALLFALFWAYAHALKSSCLRLILVFYSLFYHLPLKLIIVRRVWTQLPYSVERGRGFFQIHLCESSICYIYVKDTVYCVFLYLIISLFVVSQQGHIIEYLSQHTTLLVSVAIVFI